MHFFKFAKIPGRLFCTSEYNLIMIYIYPYIVYPYKDIGYVYPYKDIYPYTGFELAGKNSYANITPLFIVGWYKVKRATG